MYMKREYYVQRAAVQSYKVLPTWLRRTYTDTPKSSRLLELGSLIKRKRDVAGRRYHCGKRETQRAVMRGGKKR